MCLVTFLPDFTPKCIDTFAHQSTISPKSLQSQSKVDKTQKKTKICAVPELSWTRSADESMMDHPHRFANSMVKERKNSFDCRVASRGESLPRAEPRAVSHCDARNDADSSEQEVPITDSRDDAKNSEKKVPITESQGICSNAKTNHSHVRKKNPQNLQRQRSYSQTNYAVIRTYT